jgi:CheY-like chemotaxis protein
MVVSQCDEMTQDDGSGVEAGFAVLVADDDTAVRESLVWLLEDAGYHAREAADGVRALDILRTSEDRLVVLLDYMMPRMNGDGVLGAVAQEPALAARHAFILITANGRTLPLSFVKLLTELAVMVVPKPFDVDALLDAVAQAAARLQAQG